MQFLILLSPLAVRTGLEPATSGVTGRHSNQLNYRTIIISLAWLSMREALASLLLRVQSYGGFLNPANILRRIFEKSVILYISENLLDVFDPPICFCCRLFVNLQNMKRIALLLAGLLACGAGARATVPDSVYMYFYTDLSAGGHDAMHWAWSHDGTHWQNPAPWHTLMMSDYGSWGSEKRMLAPFVTRDSEGRWHALWSVNERDATLAHTWSDDLVNWHPQDYPALGGKGHNCMDPEARPDGRSGQYLVTWLDVSADGDTTCMGCLTPDFKHYSAARPVPADMRLNARRAITSVKPQAAGTVARASRREMQALANFAEAEGARNARHSEDAASDAARWADMAPVSGTLTVGTADAYAISPMLMGVFFEDISRAADGGLYAELVQNRDFEYDPEDCNGADPTWGPTHSWTARGVEFGIGTDGPIHPNNPHYATTAVGADGGALCNAGFDGIAVRKGEKYDFSMFARVREGARKVRVSLIAPDGRTLATGSVTAPLSRWGKVKTTLTASETCDSATLALEPAGAARLDADMVSLFPRTTFRGRRNGLRADLADTIAALRPRFVRFPGGCVAHGDGLGNIYRWKNTIGPLEARKPQRNLWGYHQTAGLGYHEYFEFCEDLGAEPLPVVAAGVPCQNSWHGGAGQQGGIPMDEMDEYVQDVLDLIEYANGDARTTRWGRERARNGHAEPFGLNYLGVGNEDFISEVFKERFAMIFKAVRERYPEITVIGTVGPFRSGSDYEEGWAFATAQGVPVVDEHYYESPGWFIYNQDYYDAYDRSQPHVYLGEYASRGNTLYNALAEAAYLCGTERNGDVVEMTSYAPLLAKEGRTSWNPDMIYFTNTEVHPTVNYRVQRLFGENAGTAYVPSQLTLDTADGAVRARVAASVVTTDGGDTIVKLVNILPAEVRLAMELPEGGAAATTLSGDARSTSDYSLAQSTLDGGRQTVTLPPYSMTVIKYRR